MKSLTTVIVNYNSSDYLADCLESIDRETRLESHRIVVVDNASQDQNFSRLKTAHPTVKFLLNELNLGFSKACNQGIRECPADFYLLLNPDTVIKDSAIDRTLDFLSAEPLLGAVGCQILNPDGSLQRAARRAIPTPAVAFYHFSGLATLFPSSPRFGRYNMTYLEASQSGPVEAISGSFLMFSQRLVDRIGLLDEDFFLYGEDLDFCYRALNAGFVNYYFSDAQILHHKRRSSSRDTGAATFHYYNAMKLFHRKHFKSRSHPITNALILAAIEGMYRFRQFTNWAVGGGKVGSSG